VTDVEAQRLLARLLADADFRARFEADPAAAARAAGFSRFAEDLAAADVAPPRALDVRESRSSLAGALVAAAAEGFALLEGGGGRIFGIDEAYAAAPAGDPGRWDPDWFGMTGSGGPMTPETEALLNNENVTFEPAGIGDLTAGRIDPRVVAVLTEVSKEHDLVVTCMSSDHPMNTAGGSISNHYYGRGIDIGSVDGKSVNAGNAVAREVAEELAKLDPSIRPSEIGSPWALPGAAYFTDGDHQDHLHVGFDDPITADWKPPEDADTPAVAVAAAAQAQAPAPPLSPDPDDWEGNLDDEDGGADELDGSNEDEADEAGGEDDDSVAPSADRGSPDAPAAGGDDEEGADDEEGGDDEEGDDEDEEDEDEGADEPGEGSNGEDAVDDNAGGEDSSGGSGNDSGADDAEDDSENPDEDDRQDPDPSGDSNDGTNDGSSEAPDPDPGAALDVPDDYPGDDATKQEVAAWMAAEAEKRGVPPELPVMASLVESGLRNLSYGDADSVGFFQMRTSVWDQGDYEGYTNQPALQLKWFLDKAGAVKQDRLAAGAPVDDPASFGEWIADVERPAEQYRGRYQLRLDEARSLLDADAGGDAASPSPGDEAQVLRAVDPDDGT
jgi:hypothetical protein